MLLIPIKQSLVNNAYTLQMPIEYSFLKDELSMWIKDDINDNIPQDHYIGGIGYLADRLIGVAYRIIEGPRDAFGRATKIINGLVFSLNETQGVSLNGILEHHYLESTDVQITVKQYAYTTKIVNALNISTMYEYAAETITKSRLFKVHQSLEQPPLIVDISHNDFIPKNSNNNQTSICYHKIFYKKVFLIIFVICIFILGYICGKASNKSSNNIMPRNIEQNTKKVPKKSGILNEKIYESNNDYKNDEKKKTTDRFNGSK